MAACRRRNIMLVILGGFSGFAQRAKYGEEEEERGGNNAPPCSAVIKNVWIFCLLCAWTKKALPLNSPPPPDENSCRHCILSLRPTGPAHTHTPNGEPRPGGRTETGGFIERGVVRSFGVREDLSINAKEREPPKQQPNSTTPPMFTRSLVLRALLLLYRFPPLVVGRSFGIAQECGGDN